MACDELICRMVGAAEDYLWTRKVDLLNTDPRAEEDDDKVIYGRDFKTLYNDFLDDYLRFCDATQNGDRSAFYILIDDMIETVERLLRARKVNLGNTQPRRVGEENDIIYGSDYTALYSDFYEVVETELWGC